MSKVVAADAQTKLSDLVASDVLPILKAVAKFVKEIDTDSFTTRT